MPRNPSSRQPATPSYRLHKPSGRAVVTLNGRDHYLGEHGTAESRAEYDRLISEWLANGRRPTSHAAHQLTVTELCVAYFEYASGYYVKDGQPTGHLHVIQYTLKALRTNYGHTQAVDFGPLSLQAFQNSLIEAGMARKTINQRCGIVKRMFKWAVSQEKLPASTYQALATVGGLKQGRCAARETTPVPPVDQTTVDATLPHLPEVVADMVRFHRLVGCRPSEVCMLRPCDVDTSGNIWCYVPESHKTEHHGRERRIFIGPKAQEILRPYLLREKSTACFARIDSEKKRKAEMRAHRKTKVQPSQVSRRMAKRKRPPRDHYTKDTYNRAVARACKKAKIDHWSPNRLRHAAATEIRKRFGLEASQVVLGHASADVTQIYADRDYDTARRIMGEVG